MKIYLLRHGETDWSKVGRLQGHTDNPLNERGIRQICDAGDYFLREGETIDVIVSSPLIRARKSAEIIADKIGYDKGDIVIEQGLIERCFGPKEGLTGEEFATLTAKERAERIAEKGAAETVDEICERAGVAIQKVCDEHLGKTILITAHGSIIKAILAAATKGAHSFNEGVAIFGTGEFCILEYDGNVFTTQHSWNTV